MEIKDKVVLTEDDIKLVEDFFAHYNNSKLNNLVITDSLRNEIDKFKKLNTSQAYTVEDQKAFTIALSGALANTSHPLLRDPAIADVIGACQEVWADAQFYEELEKTISTPHQSSEED